MRQKIRGANMISKVVNSYTSKLFDVNRAKTYNY